MSTIKPEKVLHHLIPDPGQQFSITNLFPNPGLTPGSIAYAIGICGTTGFYQNVVMMKALVLRKGKTGKPRIEEIRISLPIFICFDNESKFRNVMPTPEIMPNFCSHSLCTATEDLLAVPPLEFVCWVVSVTKHLRSLASCAQHQPNWLITERPRSPYDIINVLPFLGHAYREKGREYIEEHFTKREARVEIIRTIRRFEMLVSRIRLIYELTKLSLVIDAARFLAHVNDQNNEGAYGGDVRFVDDPTPIVKAARRYRQLWLSTQDILRALNVRDFHALIMRKSFFAA